MSKYEVGKANARTEAIRIQNYLTDNAVSYEELAEIQIGLEHLAKRYGLKQEFEENGVL